MTNLDFFPPSRGRGAARPLQGHPAGPAHQRRGPFRGEACGVTNPPRVPGCLAGTVREAVSPRRLQCRENNPQRAGRGLPAAAV